MYSVVLDMYVCILSSCSSDRSVIQYHSFELYKLASLQWLRVEVPNHIISWTVFNLYFLSLQLVCDIEVLNVEVTRPFPGAIPPILR